MVKQVILIRKDLNMPCGKIAAQSAHASVTALKDFESLVYSQEIESKWENSGSTKIVLGVKDYMELSALFSAAKEKDLPCSLIVDEGRTVFNGEYKSTAVGIGPALSTEIDEITGHLDLL